MSDNNIPQNSMHIVNVVKAFLVDCFDDPVVEIKDIGRASIQIRVQTEHGPEYWTVKVTKNL